MAMLMMLPLRSVFIAGPNTWHGISAPPTRFRSKFCRQSLTSMASMGCSAVTVTRGSLPPAAFTRMVGAPNKFGAQPTHSPGDCQDFSNNLLAAIDPATLETLRAHGNRRIALSKEGGN